MRRRGRPSGAETQPFLSPGTTPTAVIRPSTLVLHSQSRRPIKQGPVRSWTLRGASAVAHTTTTWRHPVQPEAHLPLRFWLHRVPPPASPDAPAGSLQELAGVQGRPRSAPAQRHHRSTPRSAGLGQAQGRAAGGGGDVRGRTRTGPRSLRPPQQRCGAGIPLHPQAAPCGTRTTSHRGQTSGSEASGTLFASALKAPVALDHREARSVGLRHIIAQV